jgi:hypothetical protein
MYSTVCSGLEIREYGRGDSLRWSRDTLYPQKLALISPTSGGRSVGIVRSRTKATEFLVFSSDILSKVGTSCVNARAILSNSRAVKENGGTFGSRVYIRR